MQISFISIKECMLTCSFRAIVGKAGTEVCQKASKAERQGCFGERQAEKRKADCPEVVFLVGQIFLDSSLVMGKYS